MILNNEQLRHKAHNSALSHDPYITRKRSRRSWRDIEAKTEQLRKFVGELYESRSDCTNPAEEWLLDHAEFIEEQVIVVRHELSRTLVNLLPRLRHHGEMRVSAICLDYLEHNDGNIHEDSLFSYIRAYQEVSVLSIAEVWTFPLVIRMSLISRLAEIMHTIKERRGICTLVERVLAGIGPSELTPEKLKEALEEAGQEMPLSGPLIVQLVKQLRERADDTAIIGEWLICKLENGPESLDPILSYEYQLQASYQVTTGNLIGSLRALSRWDWSEAFEKISMVEQTLLAESTGDYKRMDSSSRDTLRKRVEQLSRRLLLPENLVATQAVELAAAVHEQEEQEEQEEKDEQEGQNKERRSISRRAFVAYYLLEADGIRALRQGLKMCGKPKSLPESSLLRHATGTYFNLLTVFFAVAWIGFAAWIGWSSILSPLEWLFIMLVLALPATEWPIAAVHWFIERVRRPVPLLRYDFSAGVPADAATMVVIPLIWSTIEDVVHHLDRLELHYLANRDPHIQFAILGDFKDSEEEKLAEDADVLKAAKAGIEKLNLDYPESKFYLFQRRRQWNPSEGTWMGWERKRGKLVEFTELLKGHTNTSFEMVEGDSIPHEIVYIITLDADTQLPIESAHRMIATLHLPYNRPRLNSAGTRVVEGYGVLQPRISMTHESAQRSRLAALWSADPGIDPYVFAVSDPYQDGLGEGIFTGKGIFNIDAFYHILGERIPANRVLSHDLLEGGFLRAGLLADIELIDNHPERFRMYQKRQHRWVRGDWQLLIWLMPRTRNRKDELLPVDLSILTRWQMIDNLRRSLLPPAFYFTMLLALTVLPGSSLRWIALVIATCFLPVLRQLLPLQSVLRRSRSIAITAGQVVVTIITLPFQSLLLLDAILRTLARLFVTKRRLLEWIPSAEVERSNRLDAALPLHGMYGGYIFIILFLGAAIWNGDIAVQIVGLVLSLLWACAPLIINWLDKAPQREVVSFSNEERESLRKLSGSIWSFYEDYVTSEDNWLPPDNVQLDPAKGIAHRTSPTNIGLYLSCVSAARDFGFIDTPGWIERLEQTMDTIERLEKWEGHLFNWYETTTLEPLPPLYVSTVDSGNYVGCLIAVREGLQEWLELSAHTDHFPTSRKFAGHRDRTSQVAFSEEIAPSKSVKARRAEAKDDWLERGRRLAAAFKKQIDETNFRPLYDHRAKLFSIGYHAGMHKRDEVLYDLMASEARQASFIAIALGQVSVSHWHALGRTMTRAGKRAALLSWSGTMFEYLMPWLLMRTYRNTIWDGTYAAVVDRQIEYAKQRRVPFGISESGYYAFDYQMNYQYRAFGVPGLGFKRGLEQDLVVSPYATILALPFAKEEGLQALKQIEQLGGLGQYGYYEAIDFTRKRLPIDRKHVVIRSFMAHHQGMSMLTLANLLLPQKMYDRFHRNKQVRATELLLQERSPRMAKVINHPAMNRIHAPYTKPVPDEAAVREYHSAHSKVPEVCILSNGAFTTMVTNSGSGYSAYEGLAVSRWREDPVTDPWGSYVYIRDVMTDKLWSPSYQPCQVEPAEQRIQFGLDHANFQRVDGGIETSMDICVSPEWNAEVRRITLTNTGNERKVLEVTTFVELALAYSIADDAHPAFSKLFIRTDYDKASGCLVAGRRAREAKDRTLWAAHSLIIDGQPNEVDEYETDRVAFIGRGHRMSEPQAIRSRLRGTVGSVADPAFVMRRRVSIEPGEQQQLVIVTAVADTREEAVDIVLTLVPTRTVERAFQMAWHHGQIELRNLHMSNREAAEYQNLAAKLLYTPPLRTNREHGIFANAKGQSGLWAFGLSGERPVVLVHIDNRSQLPFVVKLLTGHEYLRRLGLLFDLVLLNEAKEGYHQPLQEVLQHAMEQGVDRFGKQLAGVYVLAEHTLAEADITLLKSVAPIELQAGGASFAAQLRPSRQQDQVALPAELIPVTSVEKSHEVLDDGTSLSTSLTNTKDWLFFNSWGGFSPDGKQYRIIIKDGRHLPAPWINVLANPRFGCLISEMGTGYTWWRNSRECKLTPWSNDPVLDPPTETGYIRDEDSGEVWSVAPSAMNDAPPYWITHGWGFTRFDHERCGIKHEMTVFVPLEDPVKVIRLKLRNNNRTRKRISITYYAEWVLGVTRQANAPYIVTEWVEPTNVMLARNTYQETFRDATAFLGMYPQLWTPDSGDSSRFEDLEQDHDAVDLSWTADRNEFIGRNGNMEHPAAMDRSRLSGRTGTQYDSCGAIQQKLTLEPEEERTVYIILGCDQSKDAATELARQYSQPSVCEQALLDVSEFWEHSLSQMTVSTPSPEADVLLNGWLLYQSIACRIWARSAFYQAGGAYGFRDQLQDSLAILHTMPEMTKVQIVLNASHQYEEGDVQHWWHEETERGIRTRFTDDLLWLPYTVSRYIEHTGDLDILTQSAPFLHSEPLAEGEHERYEPTQRSTASGTIYEHCLRAIDLALSRTGEHGLPSIGVGDWNDGMNLVGAEGRGESVWLGWFICEVLQRFMKVSQQRGDAERATAFQHRYEQLAVSLNEHAWDGQWYRRAYTDAGTWLGSIHNEECRIDAIAQSWSVISGVAPHDRAVQAMQSFDRELVDRELSVVRLLTPPFDRTDPSPGYIQGYPPGIRENGAQYTHGVIWSIVAWCRLGRGDKAVEMFQMLNPLNHTRTGQEVRKYTGEPYVMAADVYTAEPHEGHVGWTWYTGASGWMYQAGIESILGIQRRGEQLLVDPCIPSEWPQFSVTYRFGKTRYFITVYNHSGKSTGISAGNIDGQEIRLSKGSIHHTCLIDLRDDGQDHDVELIM